MLTTQNAEQKNFLPTALSEGKNLQEENISGELVIFSKDELAHFIDEVNKQFAESGGVDFGKATRNARYLARLDTAFANIESGRWTEHELIEVDDDE